MKKLAFLVYDSRSGSTLLAAILNQVEGMHVMPESDFLPRLLLAQLDKKPIKAEGIIDFISEEPHYRELELSHAVLRTNLSRYAEHGVAKKLVLAVVATYFGEGLEEGEGVVLIKSGYSLVFMPEIAAIFPEAVFLHIVRDGRAVCASKMRSKSTWQRTMGRSILGNAKRWANRMALAEQFTGNLLEVRFEDVVLHTDDVRSKIINHLDVPANLRTVAASIDDYSGKIGERQKPLHGNIGVPDATHIEKWRTQLSTFQIAYFERLCGGYLRRYNYQLQCSSDLEFVNSMRFRLWVILQKCHLIMTNVSKFVSVIAEGRTLEVYRQQRRDQSVNR